MKKNLNSLPLLLVDTREQRPLQFVHLPAESATLYTGDYSVKGLEESFCVERKTVTDMVQSLTRERARFMKEMHRMGGFRWAYLLIIGKEIELYSMAEQGRANVKQFNHSLMALSMRYNVGLYWFDSADAAALAVESLAFCAYRESLKPAGVILPFPDWAACTMRAIQKGGVK